MAERDPSTQFQVGEPVLLIEPGILTTVSGYLWSESVGAPPIIVAYKLSCGISVPESAIRKRAVKPTTAA
jgi:hypothetical protein